MRSYDRAIAFLTGLALISIFSAAQSQSPQQAAAKIEQLIGQNQLQQAIDGGNIAIAQWPGSAQIHHLLGIAYFKSGELTGGAEQLKQAVTLAPQQADMHYD